MERLLEKLNETTTTILREVTDQGKEIKGLSAKMEVYSKRQDEFSSDLKEVTQTARDAFNSTKSAHNRLNSIEEDLEELPTKSDFKSHSERIAKLERVVFWAATLVVGAVIIGVINLLIKP